MQIQKEEGSTGLFGQKDVLAVVSNIDFKKNDRNKFVCEHCKKKGHTKNRCWILHPHLKPTKTSTGVAAMAEHDVNPNGDDGFDLGDEIPLKESGENTRRGETQTDCSTHESLEKDEADNSIENTLSLDKAAAFLRGSESLKLNTNDWRNRSSCYYNPDVSHPIEVYHSLTTFPNEDLSMDDDLEGEHY